MMKCEDFIEPMDPITWLMTMIGSIVGYHPDDKCELFPTKNGKLVTEEPVRLTAVSTIEFVVCNHDPTMPCTGRGKQVWVTSASPGSFIRDASTFITDLKDSKSVSIAFSTEHIGEGYDRVFVILTDRMRVEDWIEVHVKHFPVHPIPPPPGSAPEPAPEPDPEIDYVGMMFTKTTPENVQLLLDVMPMCEWCSACSTWARYRRMEAEKHGLNIGEVTVVDPDPKRVERFLLSGHRVNVFDHDGKRYYTTNLYPKTCVVTYQGLLDAMTAVGMNAERLGFKDMDYKSG